MQLIAVAPYPTSDGAMVDFVYRVEEGRYVLKTGVHADTLTVDVEELDEIEFLQWAAIAGANIIPVPAG